MEDTITYVNEKLGGINAYLKSCGLEEWELSQIRVNLLAQAAPKDLLERLRRSVQTTLLNFPSPIALVHFLHCASKAVMELQAIHKNDQAS